MCSLKLTRSDLANYLKDVYYQGQAHFAVFLKQNLIQLHIIFGLARRECLGKPLTTWDKAVPNSFLLPIELLCTPKSSLSVVQQDTSFDLCLLTTRFRIEVLKIILNSDEELLYNT